MAGYPVILDLASLPALVVGGGAVAARRVEGLVAAGGAPDVVSPELCGALAGLVAEFGITAYRRPYRDGDADGYRLVVAATDSAAVNAEVARDAGRAGALVNIVDDPAGSDFVVPAVVRQGDVLAAVFSGGASPLLAAALRDRIAGIITPGLGRIAARLAALREELHGRWPDDGSRRIDFWTALVTEEFVDLALAGRDEEVESRIEACLSR